MRRIAELGKVVVQTREKKLYKGFSKSDFITDSKVKLIDEKGNQFDLPLEDLKAVFFVRDFNGNPEYDEVRFLTSQEKPIRWIVAELQFTDGEVVEGKIRNDQGLLNEPGFYLYPTDEVGNTEVIYVVKSSTVAFKVIGLK
jgi:hypothetical protein